ncbi:MAG: protease inhibitor I9 family protein, partial [Haloarculaceae archaeon]
MGNVDISRRDLLSGMGAGVGALALGGEASAAQSANFIVGTSTPAATRAAERAADAVTRVHDFGSIGQAVAGRFSESALDALRNNPNVRYVEENGRMHAIAQSLPWGIDRVDADILHDNGETGDGADVAIIDTGIDDDHPDLQANVGVGKAFVDCKGSNCNYPWSDD